MPQSQTAALPRPQEEEETDKSKQATERTWRSRTPRERRQRDQGLSPPLPPRGGVSSRVQITSLPRPTSDRHASLD